MQNCRELRSVTDKQHSFKQLTEAVHLSFINLQQKLVLKLSMENNKQRAKALKCVTKLRGIVSVSADNDDITVVGKRIDPVKLAKKMGCVELVMVATEEEEKTALDAYNIQPLAQPIYYYAYHA